jgi:hypothetical protein
MFELPAALTRDDLTPVLSGTGVLCFPAQSRSDVTARVDVTSRGLRQGVVFSGTP